MVYLKYLKNDVKEFSNIKPESDMWHTKWKSVKDGLTGKLCDVLPHLDKFVFPNISFALQLLATTPVTSCSCERAISGMRQLKTWLRNTLGQKYFSNLCILMFNKDTEVNLDSDVDDFAGRNQRRMQLRNVFNEIV